MESIAESFLRPGMGYSEFDFLDSVKLSVIQPLLSATITDDSVNGIAKADLNFFSNLAVLGSEIIVYPGLPFCSKSSKRRRKWPHLSRHTNWIVNSFVI
jgi:hypothetical protein